MNSRLLTIAILVFGCQNLVAQQFKLRSLYVTRDSVFEVYSHGATEESENTGLYQALIDTPFRVHYFSETKNGLQNGIYFEFYIPSGMPKERGKYAENKKDGEWFYWDEKGDLTKKEYWDRGALIKTIK
jgi:antitoxin component YwqK of YwqJK toxin-antitoxin module